MKRSNRLVLLIGVFLAIVAFVGIAVILSGSATTKPPAVATTLPTVIATRDIPLGVAVKADMLKTEDRKIDTERKPGAFANSELVVGQVTRRSVTAGAQIEEADFTETGGVSQLQVPPGMRAIAVQVDQISGVGTVIKTGDYVDMIVGLTGAEKFPVVELDPQTDAITIVPGVNSTSIKLLLEGMQVIGTLLPAPTTVAANPEASGAADQAQPATTLTEQSEIVILAVTAQQAEVIQFAKTDGLITLTLRSPADFVDADGQPVLPAPAGTTGIILKTLIDGGYGVLKPEVIEAILPTQ